MLTNKQKEFISKHSDIKLMQHEREDLRKMQLDAIFNYGVLKVYLEILGMMKSLYYNKLKDPYFRDKLTEFNREEKNIKHLAKLYRDENPNDANAQKN